MKWTDIDMKLAYQGGYQTNDYMTATEWLERYKKSKQVYTEFQISSKINEARTILKKLVDEQYVNKTLALTLLALCGIKPDTEWKDGFRSSMKMSKEIIKFAVDYYGLPDIVNNRDQFRREGINILLNYELIDLNPDNQSLGPNSPLTHYAIKTRVLNKLKELNVK